MMTWIKAFAVEHEITCVVLNENGPLIEKLPSVLPPQKSQLFFRENKR